MLQQYKLFPVALAMAIGLMTAPVLTLQMEGQNKMPGMKMGKGKKPGKSTGTATKKASISAGKTSAHTKHSGHKPGMDHKKMSGKKSR
jgi:hypothetical protein